MRSLGAMLAALLCLAEATAQEAKTPDAPPKRPAVGTVQYVGAQEGGGTVDLWDSFASAKDCTDATFARFMADLQNQTKIAQAGGGVAAIERYEKDHPSPPPPAVCTEGVVAKLTRGTSVKVLPGSKECEDLIPVRVASRKYEGKIGCMAAARLQGGSQ